MYTNPLHPNHNLNQLNRRENSRSPPPPLSSVFPEIDSLNKFKHHLSNTLKKFQDPNLVNSAHEEIHDLMSEHITNSDRMNAFLSALAQDGGAAPGTLGAK